MMGYLTAAGSLARITGPIYMGQMYSTVGPRLSLAIILAMLILSVFLGAWHYSKFVPYGTKELFKIHYSDMEGYGQRKSSTAKGEVNPTFQGDGIENSYATVDESATVQVSVTVNEPATVDESTAL